MISAEIQPDESNSRLTIRRSIAEGTRFLEGAGIEEARLDAEVLLAHAIGINRFELYLNLSGAMTETVNGRYRRLLERRSAREPVAYITGRKEFWSMDFIVTPDVLIPRPETELLVEIAAETLRRRQSDRPLRILDLCTGSGAVAISIAREIGGAQICATDIRPEALAVAARNTNRHGLSDRIQMIEGDLFNAVKPTGVKFDGILCNPPYIRTADLSELLPEVNRWEPRIALDGGTDGLSIYRRLAAEAFCWLESDGQLFVEIGADMADAVAALFAAAGGYDGRRLYQDYAGRDRVMAVSAKTPADPQE